MKYNTAAIMRAAHAAAKRMIAAGQWVGVRYNEVFSFYLRQKWVTAQHEASIARCTGKPIALVKAFDNGGSPIWRM